jgi:hypothetical protein
VEISWEIETDVADATYFCKISLLILHLLITSEAWQAKVQPAMFSRRSAVSLFPASGNCSKAGC